MSTRGRQCPHQFPVLFCIFYLWRGIACPLDELSLRQYTICENHTTVHRLLIHTLRHLYSRRAPLNIRALSKLIAGRKSEGRTIGSWSRHFWTYGRVWEHPAHFAESRCEIDMNRSYPSFETDLHCRSALLIRLPSLPSSSATCSAHTQLHGDFSKWMEWTYFCITGISERGVFLTSSGGTTKQFKKMHVQ